jgi:hypothetical protein
LTQALGDEQDAAAGLFGASRAAGYWRERRGRSLIQARIPIATSSQGESRRCTVKLRIVRATMAMRARTMIPGIVIGLR